MTETASRDQEPASVTALFKAWIVNSGQFEQDPECKHWGVFWEPLDVDLPPDARPHCCYVNDIVFYDRTGNKLLAGPVRHFQFIGPHPQLLNLAGCWREVISGRCQYHNGRWCMRWAVATNTRFAILLNSEKR